MYLVALDTILRTYLSLQVFAPLTLACSYLRASLIISPGTSCFMQISFSPLLQAKNASMKRSISETSMLQVPVSKRNGAFSLMSVNQVIGFSGFPDISPEGVMAFDVGRLAAHFLFPISFPLPTL